MSITWDGDLYWVATIDGPTRVTAKDREDAMQKARIVTCAKALDAGRVPDTRREPRWE